MNYYIAVQGQQLGPFPPEQLLAQGLRPESQVWCDGMPQWQRADMVAELQPILASAPTSPPPTASYAAPGYAAPGYSAPGNYSQPGPFGQPGQFGVPVGSYPPVGYASPDSNKLAAGLCGIMLGAFGVHKFILGYTGAGTIMLLVSLLTCGLGAPVMHVIGLIEGIIYLTKSDAEFHQMYVVQKKEWF